MNSATPTIQHYTPHASLAAIGAKIKSLKLFDTISEEVRILQKTVRHQPVEKLQDAFIAILSGAHGLCEINTRVRTDEALQRAFGRTCCAEQSVVQQTLDACTEENVAEMERAIAKIFRQHSQAVRHNYRTSLQLLDLDLTGLPCGPKAELSKKGYFAQAGIRYGRQLGRVIATHYEEIVVDQLYSGNVKLGGALQQLVRATEQMLDLTVHRRERTVLRIDAGGGALDDVNWLLGRGYQLHCKDCSSERAKSWAGTVQVWFADPKAPDERQYGWVVPEDTPDYVRTVRRIAIRWHKRLTQPPRYQQPAHLWRGPFNSETEVSNEKDFQPACLSGGTFGVVRGGESKPVGVHRDAERRQRGATKLPSSARWNVAEEQFHQLCG